MVRKTAKIVKDRVEIRFPFSWETLDKVKSITGRRFHDDDSGKYWTCPISVEAIEVLEEDGFHISQELKDEFPGRANLSANELEEINVPGLKKTLYPFQRKGVALIERRGGKALLADEMGLGKTIQALAWLQLHPELRPAIVVCPAHMKLEWAKEVEDTLPFGSGLQVIEGRDTNRPLIGDIIIINYDILPNQYKEVPNRKTPKEIPYTGWVDHLMDLKPKALVIDESHYIKNNKTYRTKATKKMARKIPHVLALSGTPIINRPIEAYNALQIVDRRAFPNFWQFVHRYCGAKKNRFGWDFTGATNKEELHQRLLNTVMIRRLKSEVLPELPDKTWSYVPIQIDNTKEYIEAERDFILYLRARGKGAAAEKAEKAEHLVKIGALKQLAVKGKMAHATRWIKGFLEDNGKLVLFAVHKKTIEELMKTFGDVAVKVDGSTSSKKRREAVRAFQEDDDVRLFIGNIQAAGTGLTLTAASSVAFLELPWTPGELVQAEDRCHRIGQKNAVNVYYLLADKTVEGEIARLLDEKRKVLGAVLDGKPVEEIHLLQELIEAYEGRGK